MTSNLVARSGFLVLFASLAACGGSSSTFGPGSSTEPSAADLAGSWNGSWLSKTGQGGATTSTFAQAGGSLSGTIAFTSSPCFSSGNIAGTVSGDDFVATVTAGDIRVDLTGTVTDNAYSGTYTATQAGACTGDTGTFTAKR